MTGMLKIGQVAALLAAKAIGSCSERRAWDWVDANPKLIQRCPPATKRKKVKGRTPRGPAVFFRSGEAENLCAAIVAGKAVAP